MRQIKLTKAWGSRKKGALLDVWEPGSELLLGMVDGQRAARLVADGFAVALEPKPAESPAAAEG